MERPTWLEKDHLPSVLLPGAFITLAATLAAAPLAGTDSPQDDALAALELATRLWPLAVVGLVSAYLAGHVVRAFTVSQADAICGSFFSLFAVSGWVRMAYSSEFPYPALLRDILAALQAYGQAKGFQLPRDADCHTVFEFWKARLCAVGHPAFQYSQRLEERVRLFAGMFYAGIAGFVITVAAAALAFLNVGAPAAWGWVYVAFAAGSVGVIGVFGWHLRAVRVREAQAVFLAILELENRQR